MEWNVIQVKHCLVSLGNCDITYKITPCDPISYYTKEPTLFFSKLIENSTEETQSGEVKMEKISF
jgi:hypothetical protein